MNIHILGFPNFTRVKTVSVHFLLRTFLPTLAMLEQPIVPSAAHFCLQPSLQSKKGIMNPTQQIPSERCPLHGEFRWQIRISTRSLQGRRKCTTWRAFRLDQWKMLQPFWSKPSRGGQMQSSCAPMSLQPLDDPPPRPIAPVHAGTEPRESK